MTLMTGFYCFTVLCSCRHKQMVEGEERVKMMQIQLVDLKPLPDSTTAATEVQQLQQQYNNSNHNNMRLCCQHLMASFDSDKDQS